MRTDPILPHPPIRDCLGAPALPRCKNGATLNRVGRCRPFCTVPLMHRLPGWILFACWGLFFGQVGSEAAPRPGYDRAGSVAKVRRDAKPRPYLGHAYVRPSRVPRPSVQRVPVGTYSQRMEAAPRSPRPSFEGYTGRRRSPVLRPPGDVYSFRPEPTPRLRPVQGLNPSPKPPASGKKNGTGIKSPGQQVKLRDPAPKPPAAPVHLPPEMPFAPDKERSAAVSSESPATLAPAPKPEGTNGGGDYDHLPVATPVPGRAGFVTLPGNHAGLPEIDVRGIDSGTAAEIPDPTIPGSTIQFRVP